MAERSTLEDVKNHEYFKGMDWSNIGSYKEYEEQATAEEKFWAQVRAKLRELTEEKEKEANEKEIDKIIAEYLELLEKSEDFDETTKERLKERIKFSRRQARAYSNIESFEW